MTPRMNTYTPSLALLPGPPPRAILSQCASRPDSQQSLVHHLSGTGRLAGDVWPLARFSYQSGKGQTDWSKAAILDMAEGQARWRQT